jgi:hypothetical protein
VTKRIQLSAPEQKAIREAVLTLGLLKRSVIESRQENTKDPWTWGQTLEGNFFAVLVVEGEEEEGNVIDVPAQEAYMTGERSNR